jgi:hypothetical protein
MPVDTREKRAGAVYVGLPWRGQLPLPDGAIAQADRQQVAYMYPGILATASTALYEAIDITVPFENRTFAVTDDGRMVIVSAEDRTFVVRDNT